MSAAEVLVFDPESIQRQQAVEALGRRIVAASGRLSAATCDWLKLVAEFDAENGAERYGLPSTARWLEWACGISHRTAAEHVRVARGLVEQPALVDEMGSGRLSYSHVRAITRVATPDEPELVDGLVGLAHNGTVRHLESVVRGLRTSDHNDAVARGEIPKQVEHYVKQSWTSDNNWRLSALLDAESGALVSSVLTTVAESERISLSLALTRMAEIALAAINDASASVHSDLPRLPRGDERAAVIIELDAGDLPALDTTGSARETAATDPPRSRERAAGRIRNGPGLSRAVIDRLLCDGRIRTAVTKTSPDGQRDVLNLGRSHRVVTDRQFKALLIRDHGCTYPGCATRRNLRAHHVVHWIDGGPTDLDNLVLLCHAHHLKLHDGEYEMEAAGPDADACADSRRQRFVFTRDGKQVLHHPVLAADEPPPPSVDDEFVAITHDDAASRWRGERLDHHYAINVFAMNRNAHRWHARSRERDQAADGDAGQESPPAA